MYTFCYKVLSPRRQIPNRLSVFSVFNCRYSVFFAIVNTDVGVGIGISKYRISVRYFSIPTQDYCLPQAHGGGGSSNFVSGIWPLIAPGYLGDDCHASHQPSDAYNPPVKNANDPFIKGSFPLFYKGDYRWWDGEITVQCYLWCHGEQFSIPNMTYTQYTRRIIVQPAPGERQTWLTTCSHSPTNVGDKCRRISPNCVTLTLFDGRPITASVTEVGHAHPPSTP